MEFFPALEEEGREVEMLAARMRIPSLDHLIALKLHALKHTRAHRFLKDFQDLEGLLVINNIEPQGEQKQSFYASIPIVMSVTGNYHEIGVFLDSISKLARIVNVTNIKMGSPKTVNEKLVVQASYIATTFRFLPEAK